MKHVIVGGRGFTGRYLVEALLARGEQVTVADIAGAAAPLDESAVAVDVDVRSSASLQKLELDADDIVHHLAANQFHGPVPKRGRDIYFNEVNVTGTANLLEHMARSGCRRMIYFSTDMVYGVPQSLPVDTDHPQNPLGPYGESKRISEGLVRDYRERGFDITVFRPRLIIGPGRLGVLEKLFRLIRAGLPVPLIGNGSNHYQMVSVHDCVTADLLAVDRGIPNEAFNLGSKNPPTVRQLLGQLIEMANSRSFLLSTPAGLVKLTLGLLDACGMTLLHREQYAIADVNYLLDIKKTEEMLGWNPAYRDEDMLVGAFREYLDG